MIIKNITSVRLIIALITILITSGCNLMYKKYYTNPTESLYRANQIKPYDVIIVPGYPAEPDSLNAILSERISWANYLFTNGYAKNIIFSGSAVYTPYVEAEAMKLYALQIGLPPENLFTETKAEHTTENVYYSYKKAKTLGFEKIAFATQSYQASFMKAFIRKFKLEIDLLPVVNDSLNKYPVEFKPLDIKEAFVTNFVSIKEREGFFKRISGTAGRKVKADIRKERRLKKKQLEN